MVSGSIIALVTPMTAGGDVDWRALEALVDWHLQEGTRGFVAMGTTGESATLDVAEHCRVIEEVVGRVARQVPVIAGTGANSTTEAIELTEEAKKLGADVCLLVTPYYNKPTQEGLYQHFRAVAEAVDIPQLLYNVPGRTACDLLPETVERLSVVDNIIGIKEATGDIERGRQVRQRCPEDFILLSGDDATFLGLMEEAGARGNISVTANVAPGPMSRVCQAALDDDFATAKELNEPLLLLHSGLFVEANPIPVKWALNQMGKIAGGIRLPLTPLSESAWPEVRRALQEAGLV